MLSEFELIDFKSYDQATLQFGTLEQGAHRFSPLTVLIGANASGKSNLIEGLRLLSLIARGTRLDTIRPGQDASGLRGGLGDLGFRGASKFSFRCRTDFEEYDEYKISLQLRDGDRLHIVEERIDSSSRPVPLFRVADPSVGVSGDIDVAYDNFARGGKKPQVVCTDQMSVLSQLQGAARFNATHKKAQQKVPDFARRYQKLLENVIFLDPRPKEMRSYSFANETRLAEQGQNLSGVLFNLCRDPDKRERLLEFIRDVPEQDIEDIGFIRTERGEVMLALQETFGGEARKYDASQLSDGTLRILAVAVAVLSAVENSVVVVEEIDNGVHPSRVEQLHRTHFPTRQGAWVADIDHKSQSRPVGCVAESGGATGGVLLPRSCCRCEPPDTPGQHPRISEASRPRPSRAIDVESHARPVRQAIRGPS